MNFKLKMRFVIFANFSPVSVVVKLPELAIYSGLI